MNGAGAAIERVQVSPSMRGPPGRRARPPTYQFSVPYMLAWLWSASTGRRRNIGADGRRELLRYHPAPRSIGAGHVPASGPFLLVMNHYERKGCNVWWAVMLASAVIWQRRREKPPAYWLVTDRLYRFRVGPVVIPDRLMSWFLRRLAAVYDFILVPRESVHRRVTVIRKAQSAVRGQSPVVLRPVALTPEGAEGGGLELGRISPSSGRVLAWLSRGEVPIIPAGVFEDDSGRLVVRFGCPFVLPWPGAAASRGHRASLGELVMSAIAQCLPPALRAGYAAGPGSE